jgi:hypothetical protein
MSNIVYVRFSPHRDRRKLTAQLVEAYRDVFAETPWHEWLKCSVCEKYWGVKDRAYLASIGYMHCGVVLVDFWPRMSLVQDLRHEITKTSSCWLALDGNTVVGFTWGYPVDFKTLESKLDVPVENTFIQFFSSTNIKIAYQDEVGVLVPYRGMKIAKELIARRNEDFVKQGLEVGVVRTRKFPEPSKTYLWYTQKLDYQTLATYTDGRVVLGRKLAGLQELLHS